DSLCWFRSLKLLLWDWVLALDSGLLRGFTWIVDSSMFGSGKKDGIWSTMLSKIRLAVEPTELIADVTDSALDGGRLDNVLVPRLLPLRARSCCTYSGSWCRCRLEVRPVSVD